MKKFVFKKDGKENQLIITGIIDFIKANYGKSEPITITQIGESLKFPCYKMLHKNHVNYMLCDIFDKDMERVNHILQFVSGPADKMVCDEESIWMGEGSEVEFVSEIEIKIKRTGGEVVVRGS